MARVMLTGRVMEQQAEALKSYAAKAGMPVYQATVRALELGIAELVGRQTRHEPDPENNHIPQAELQILSDAIERLTIRAELNDRLTRQTLYASGAAYAAAMAGISEGTPDERMAEIKREIAEDADTVFERQLGKAQEG